MGQWQNKIQCTCSQCGTGFSLAPSYIRVKNYCGEECKRRATACKCDTCGKELNIPKSYQKIKNYCSERCREIAKQKHEDKLKCVCEVCGIEYEMKRPEDRNLKHHYCSDDCKALKRLNCTCEYCGKRFYRRPDKIKGRIFCSNECYKKASGYIPHGIVICKNCEKAFQEPKNHHRICCSKRCAGQYAMRELSEKAAREREERRQKREYLEILKRELKELKRIQKELERYKPCRECGKVFRATGGRTYCSEECRKVSQNRAHDRRIQRNGKADYSINLKRLYKRDRGFCQLCGKHLEFIEDVQSGDYPSIDHIIPLAKGGLHSWDNVQLACRRCNWEKQDIINPPASIYFSKN